MLDTPALRKARGAFFTPQSVSRFLVDWAIRNSSDKVLEPSCGEAAFLLQAGIHLKTLGSHQVCLAGQLHGIEIHEATALSAIRLLNEHGLDADIKVSDFFDIRPTPVYDAIIGNPPYVRYQAFSGEARTRGIEAALANGVRLSRLTSSWAPFVVHAAQFLNPSGRLALVLPAELLSVNYASPIRRFLLKRFASVRLVLFDHRIFPEVQEEVVLLLAEGSGGVAKFEVYQAKDGAELSELANRQWKKFEPKQGEKWNPALLTDQALATYRSVLSAKRFCLLKDWGHPYLGSVTGSNAYFALDASTVEQHGITDADLLRISPPGSRHLSALAFTDRAWQQLSGSGARCFLFYPCASPPSATAWRYIHVGELLKVNEAYKCRKRKPWWRVPVVGIPDLFLTYMSHQHVRLVSNEANAHIVNSVHGVRLHDNRRSIGKQFLPLACLNSLTLLGSEMVGRAYGGGLLKLEPKEASNLPVPSLRAIQSAQHALSAIKPQINSLLGRGNLPAAVELVDRVFLKEQLMLSERDVATLRQQRGALWDRRKSRGKNGSGSN